MKIASEALKGEQPDAFLVKHYPIPSKVLQDAKNHKVAVKFKATQWLAGGVFDMRLMKAE